MIRFLTVATLLIAIAPAAASASSYSAMPIAPLAAKRIVSGDLVWTCGPAACRGSTGSSRPLVLCQGLAKKAGRLVSFTADGRALPAAELDKCNSAARGVTAPAVAQAR